MCQRMKMFHLKKKRKATAGHCFAVMWQSDVACAYFLLKVRLLASQPFCEPVFSFLQRWSATPDCLTVAFHFNGLSCLFFATTFRILLLKCCHICKFFHDKTLYEIFWFYQFLQDSLIQRLCNSSNNLCFSSTNV